MRFGAMPRGSVNRQDAAKTKLSSARFSHDFPQARRPHVCPDAIDECQAIRLQTRMTCFGPSLGCFPIDRPDRVLPFGVVDHLKDRFGGNEV